MESLVDATAGAIGSLASTTILYPLDTCKTKYQAELRTPNLRKYRFSFYFPVHPHTLSLILSVISDLDFALYFMPTVDGFEFLTILSRLTGL